VVSAGTGGAVNSSDQHLLDRVTDVLLALSNVELGDYSTRIEVEDAAPELEPLLRGINDMIASLEAEQKRSVDYRRDLEAKLETIERQSEAIRELSTPILEVWKSVLCLPVVGIVDTARSADMTTELLESIARSKAAYAIIDVTGIEVMDTGTADHFVRMARAARLLGAECALTGLTPTVAQTLVHMGIEIEGVRTFRTLRVALRTIVEEDRRRVQERRAAYARRRQLENR